MIYMTLIHIRVGKKLKEEMEALIKKGIFSNQAEIAREGIRDLLLKYSGYSKKRKWEK